MRAERKGDREGERVGEAEQKGEGRPTALAGPLFTLTFKH